MAKRPVPRRGAAQKIALGGVLAALAVVIMCLGGLIPLATFILPVLCALMVQLVLRRCGARIAWAWYGAVAILSLLMGPDKEAAAVFAFLGYYPIIKPRIDRMKLRWLWKGLLFNGATLIMYAMLVFLLGMHELLEDYRTAGAITLLVTLLLGNITFFMVDQLLGRRFRR